ncbi:MAG: hypothetical protein ACRDU0_20035 [Mycobacterium sp.]
MTVVGVHWPEVVFLAFLVLPWVIGFGFVLTDANRRGQPGWLWALLTIPLSWVAVLAYLVVRALTSPRQ